MGFEHIKVGDILFFSAPPIPHENTIAQIQAQLRLSLWSCSCLSKDYQLTHVAICVEKNDVGMSIAHIRATKTHDTNNVLRNGFCIDNKSFMDEKLSERQYFVLRPKSRDFSTALANNAKNPKNATINWSDEAYYQAHQFLSFLSLKKIPVNAFSQESICSRFVAEVVANTQGKKSYFDQANVSVMTLKRQLIKTDLFNLIPQDELNSQFRMQETDRLLS